MANRYILLHTHRFGVSTWPFEAFEEPDDSLLPALAKKLGVDYEANKEESLEVLTFPDDDEWPLIDIDDLEDSLDEPEIP